MTKKASEQMTYKRPIWVKQSVVAEEELCPDCFKVVGVKSRYLIVCALGKSPDGLTVTELTNIVGLRQPTVTHHLNTLRGVDAVSSQKLGASSLYKLNRKAHCFSECQIPY